MFESAGSESSSIESNSLRLCADFTRRRVRRMRVRRTMRSTRKSIGLVSPEPYKVTM